MRPSPRSLNTATLCRRLSISSAAIATRPSSKRVLPILLLSIRSSSSLLSSVNNPSRTRHIPKATGFPNSRVSLSGSSQTYGFSASTTGKAKMAPSKLRSWFPHAKAPVIISAPMLGAAGASLATEVHKAGGIGFIAAGFDFSESSAQMKDMDAALTQARSLLSSTTTDEQQQQHLPLGVGFITSHETAGLFAANVLPILVRHRVAAAWLFAPNEDLKPHAQIIPALRDAGIKAFVQVGNVAAAREAAADGADVLVAQGVDAGGHQFSRGCGVVSLVPEIKAMLASEFASREVAVVAAGGIVEGSGVAAAYALGAEGVVMGTRFVATNEAMSAQLHKELLVKTKDGGVSTWKHDFHDKLVDSKLWKPGYDGRAIIGDIHREYHVLGGKTATVEESRERLKAEWSEDEGKKMIGKWSGAGVGLINEIKPAGEVVVEVREAARKRIQELAGLI